jgi:hypothetical protein
MKDIDQVTDYMLELKNFHLGSHDAEIFPVLVASEYNGEPLKNADVECLGSWYINDYIKNIDYLLGNAADGWEESPYKPTPTIIEAARALYANHTIDEITRSEAGDNIISTCQKINEIIEDSR